jgi:cyclopropane fatty-acyl-phospholipid synthase-like methyltransferase
VPSIVDDRGFNQGFTWNPTQEVRMRRRAQAILAALPPGPQRVLEWGCGTGELAHFLATESTEVTGADLCAPFIEQASRQFGRERLRFVVANLATEAGRAALGTEWDAIVGNGILHHLYHHIGEALTSMRSMLKPGGRFVFWEPNLFNPYVFAAFSFAPLRKLAKLEPDEMAFTPAWIQGHLSTAGFSEIEVSYRDFLVPNLPFSLVPVVTRVGAVVEQVPVVNRLAQSLFITARR